MINAAYFVWTYYLSVFAHPFKLGPEGLTDVSLDYLDQI